MTSFEVHYQNNQTPDTALSLLASQTPLLSIAQLKTAISKGALWLEKGQSIQRLRRLKKIINTGETLHFYYNEEVLSKLSPKAILIDDQNEYSVWYKPSGMLSQGSKWSDHCTITRWAQTQLNGDRACFLVHRLDKATSGLIILAHTKNAARLFSQLFAQHKLIKCYQAIVCKNQALKQTITVDEPIDNKQASSHFTLIAHSTNAPLAQYHVCIDTGRKHQIRKHCQLLNIPIVGDRLYNNDHTQNKICDLQLCAVKLEFICPIKNEKRQYLLSDHLTLKFEEICQLYQLK